MFDFPSFFLQAAEFLDIPDLFAILTQKSTENSVDRKKLVLGLEDLCLSDGVFSDILFKLEDGTCAAHKPILMARLVCLIKLKKPVENHTKIFDFEENICTFKCFMFKIEFSLFICEYF